MSGFRWRFLAPPFALVVVLLVVNLLTGRHPALLLLALSSAIFVAAVAVLALRRHPGPTPGLAMPSEDERSFPPSLVGREREIDELVRLHDRIRQERAESSMARPVVLLLHGGAGVGKSALAAAASAAILAAKASPYRRGAVTVNLNSGGEPLASGHVLASLLRQLRWGGPIPPETAARVKIFRAFAAERRPLIILDAVTDAAQVAGLIPSSAGSCVIVTSRRNLGPALGVEPYEVRPLRRSASLELLHAVTRTAPYTSLVCADRLVDISGGLPVAIRAIGERVVFEEKSLCDINATLRPTRTRLQELTRGSTVVVDGIMEEFERLNPDESRALCLITLLKTPTFASWVVAPLLDVSPFAGELVVTELVNARLIEPAGRDRWLGLPRYRMNAIVRLVAENRLNNDAELLGECHVASRRLHAVFRVLGSRLTGHEPAGTAAWPDVARQWIPKPRAGQPDDAWIRTELLSLADVARGALADEPALAWRLCGLFGDTFPEPGEHLPAAQWAAELAVTLDLTAHAARHAGQAEAELAVHLAEVNLHSGTGHFRHAEQVLNRMESMVDTPFAGERSDRSREQAASALLILARGYLRAFRRAQARQALQRADRLLKAQSSLTERADVLRNVLDGDSRPPPDADPVLVAVDAGERSGEEVITNLIGLLPEVATDLPGTVAIQHRLAQAYMRIYKEGGESPPDVLLRASHHAIRGIIAAERMSDLEAVARGRCLLAEVTAAAHHPDEAWQHLEAAQTVVDKMPELAETMRDELSRVKQLVGPVRTS